MDRNNSKFINMRKLHGRIKRSLIQNSVIQCSLRYRIKSKDISVLDVSVGRFGDMHNYYFSGVRNIVGIDPDVESIREANRRYQLSKKNYPDLSATLLNETITNKTLENFNIHSQFNIIVCNFTLHYFFQSESMLTNAINNISEKLKKGGYFIGTTIVMDDSNLDVDKKDLHFKKGETYNDQTPFGRSYEFKLIDNSDSGNYFNLDASSIEYRVDLDVLIGICSKYKLKMISIRPFDKIRGNRKHFSNIERKISSLYKTFVFVKI